MPRALKKGEVALRRLMSNNWYNSGQAAINQQLSRLGVSGTAQGGNIDWGGVTKSFMMAELIKKQEEQSKARSAFYNNYYKALAGPGRTSRYGAASSPLDELYRRVESQRNQAERVGAQSQTRTPSVLERVFDVLSRPNYAMAESVRAGEEASRKRGETGLRSVDDSIKGFWEGLSGRKKTTFGDVIEEGYLTGGKPVKGKDWGDKIARGVGGFALDVLTDPLNFVGAGVVKGVSKEAIEATGKEAIEKAIRSPAIEQAGRNAISLATRANKGKALDRGTQILHFNHAVDDELRLISKKAMEDATEHGKGRIALEILGKEIGTHSGLARRASESVYSGTARVGKRFAQTTLGDSLNRAFRTRAVMPGRLHLFHRVFSGQSISELEEGIKGWRGVTKTLNRKDAEAVSRAIKEGSDLTGLMDAAGKTDLGEVQKEAVAAFEEMGKLEVLMGYKKESDLIQNYLPHYGKGPSRLVSKFHDNPKMTFEAAKDLGVTPTTDIRELVARRMARFHQRKMQHTLVKSLEEEYGIRAVIPGKSSKMGATPLTLEQAGLRKIPHIVADPQMRVPQTVATFVGEMKKLADDPEYAKDLLNVYDKVLGNWKALVTVVSPGFHVRNAIGDIFLNWLPKDGVRTFKPYKQAAKVLGNGRLGKTVRIAGKSIDIEDLQILYHQSGLNVGFFRAEFGKTLAPGMEAVRKASEMRENWTRMAHFVDRITKLAKKRGIKFTSKNIKDKLASVALEAGEEVRKFNIDYGDLTAFEKNVGKRLIPFYTWSRKFTPLLLEAIALQPGKIVKLPKAKRAIETILGTDEKDQKVEDMIPEWIKDYSALRLTGGDNPEFGLAGSVLPPQMLGEFSEPSDVARFGAGMMTPPLQMLMEQATGQKAYSGTPIDTNAAGYFADMTQPTRIIKKILQGEFGKQEAINALGGVGYQKVTDDRKMGELYRQSDILREILQKRKKELEGQLK